MATYTKSTDFAAKDALNTGNPAKLVKGTEIGAEFDAIQTADADNMKKSVMGTGVETFLTTPSSANLAAAVTGETGTGALVFGTAPQITNGDFNTPDIDGGTIDGATIATSDITVGAGKTLDVSAGTLTLANDQISGDKVEGGTINAVTINTLTVTGNVNATTVDATNVEVTNIKAKNGTASATIADSTGVMTVASAVLTTADINGGTIDGTVIGGSSAAAITGTTITANTRFVGAHDGTVGATTPAAGTFTTLTSTGNATLGDAEASDTHAIKGATTLLANSASAALTVTQTGSGNALIITGGNLGIGAATTAGYIVHNQKNLTGGTTAISFRAGTQVVQSDVTSDAIGFATRLTTAAASFTLARMTHYYAGQGTFGAGSTVTKQYGFYAESDLTGATNNYGFYGSIASGTGRWNFYAEGTAANYFAGTIASLGSYNATTASAANTFIDSAGLIQRSTSSIRYKKDVETLDHSYADNVILNARPVWYRSKCENDNEKWGWYGLIAEEVAELDPRLVHWGYPTKTVEHEPAEPAKAAVLDEEGNVVEEAIPATEATYKEVPDTDAPLQAEGVQYDRLTVMLIDVVQRQQKQIEALTDRIEALEAA